MNHVPNRESHKETGRPAIDETLTDLYKQGSTYGTPYSYQLNMSWLQFAVGRVA